MYLICVPTITDLSTTIEYKPQLEIRREEFQKKMSTFPGYLETNKYERFWRIKIAVTR